MKQVAGLISTYSSDEFGICSALFELGGMVVMHDASGCNSTYTTHDEPRWYDMDSMIYISAISEMEAIMGDDDKLIRDVTETAMKLQPAFIAIVGAPIPYMIGTDFKAIAAMVEAETGIRTIGFEANGMRDYVQGISMALEMLAEDFCDASVQKDTTAQKPKVNLIGATPLDFSMNGSIDAIKAWLTASGFEVGACFCMGSTLEEIRSAGQAHVNLVLSAGGLEAAKLLEKKFNTPYVVGVPTGSHFAPYLAGELRRALETGTSLYGYQGLSQELPLIPELPEMTDHTSGYKAPCKYRRMAVIGEYVTARSLASEIEMAYDTEVIVYSPVYGDEALLMAKDRMLVEEDDLMALIEAVDAVIADPLYEVLTKEHCTFYPWPHEAFSGRIYAAVNPNLIGKTLKNIEI